MKGVLLKNKGEWRGGGGSLGWFVGLLVPIQEIFPCLGCSSVSEKTATEKTTIFLVGSCSAYNNLI